jgi:hypothetical protein
VINALDLARRLRGRHVKDDVLMPAAYRQGARPLHDDWSVWPFTRIPRRWTWYNLPLPFKFLAGNYEPQWMPWQHGYPQSPEIKLRNVQPGTAAADLRDRFGKEIYYEVLAHDPVPPIGCWGRFAVWLDNAWRECYFTESKQVTIPFLGKRRLHRNGILKFDLSLGDFGCQFPDASLTLKEI